MTTKAYSLSDALPRVVRGWQSVFHAPCDARIAALIRIAFALVALVNLAVLFPDLGRWFTNEGVMSAGVSRVVAPPYVWSVFWWLPDTLSVVRLCFWIAVVQAALVLLGFLSRVNAMCLFVWLVSFQSRNYLIVNGEDTVIRLLAFFLIWLPCGQCWSIDAWINRKLRGIWSRSATGQTGQSGPAPGEERIRRFAAPGWGLRLLQIQMCVIFLSAGLCKLSGDAWLNGTALYYVARLDDYFGRFPTPNWPFDHPWPVALFTWSVIAIELLVPLFIWFRETRLLCLFVLVLFHLANEWTMHLFLFHWAMLVGWLAFVQPSDFTWLLSRKKDGRF